MDSVRSYLLSVVAVCICAAVAGVFAHNEMMAKTLRLISGVLILLVVLQPMTRVDLDDIAEKIGGNGISAEELEFDVREQLAVQVKRSTEAYIENYAYAQGALLQAKVEVSGDTVPKPTRITLTGSVTLEQLSTLSDYIESALGIGKSAQIWRIYEVGS